MELINIIFGGVIGFIVAWFLSKSKFDKGINSEEAENLKQNIQDLNSELSIKEEKLKLVLENLREFKEELIRKDNQVLSLQRALAGKESDLKHLNERLLENKNEIGFECVGA